VLNFAYGINITDGMLWRCPNAIDLGSSVLEEFRWLTNSRGVASVVRDPGTETHGVLWALTSRDLAVLDRFEGIATNFYRRRTAQVRRVDDGRLYEAWVYEATDPTPGPPAQVYLASIIEAARERGFPASYIAELTAWESAWPATTLHRPVRRAAARRIPRDRGSALTTRPTQR